MTDSVKEIASMIRDAFSGVELGNGIGLFEGDGMDSYADEGTLEEMRQKDREFRDWEEISPRDLQRCYSSLSYVDEEGMRFLLPAFITAQLESRNPSFDVIPMLLHLVPFRNCDGKSNVFRLLEKRQRLAISRFIKHEALRHTFNHDAILDCANWFDPQ